MIEVRDVHTYRGINYVLQGVSLTIRDGACTVLLGRNGMGKTTLVHTIMGLIRPRSGRITLTSAARGSAAARAVQHGAVQHGAVQHGAPRAWSACRRSRSRSAASR